jgi:hypothetical protein
MKFVNTVAQTLRFSAGGQDYVVRPRAMCEIRDEVAYVVKSRGLPLREVDESALLAAFAPVDESVPAGPQIGDSLICNDFAGKTMTGKIVGTIGGVAFVLELEDGRRWPVRRGHVADGVWTHSHDYYKPGFVGLDANDKAIVKAAPVAKPSPAVAPSAPVIDSDADDKPAADDDDAKPAKPRRGR